MLNTLVLNSLIFQYRDIVIEVYQILRRHYPLVKPMTFVGQSSAGKQSKGFTQKQQLKVRKQGLSQIILNILQVC
jgi:ERCC4-related helicase